MFSVVATKGRRNAKQLLTVVPSLWVEQKSIFWPPAGLLTLSKDPESVPDKSTWKKSKAKVLGQAETYCQAEDLLTSLQNQTDSEWTEDLVVAAKPKKGRFETKSCTLAEGTDHSQTINTDPVIDVHEGYSGKSSSCTVPAEVTIPEEPATIIFPGEGQFVQLQDGTFARAIPNDVDSQCCHVNELARRLDRIEQKIEKLEHILSKIDTIPHFAADVNKCMNVR